MCPAMEGCKMSPLSTSSNLNINMEKNEIMPVALISDTTGERLVFESRRKAAIFLGVEYSYLKQYLKNGRGHLVKKGYYVELLPQEPVKENALF